MYARNLETLVDAATKIVLVPPVVFRRIESLIPPTLRLQDNKLADAGFENLTGMIGGWTFVLDATLAKTT